MGIRLMAIVAAIGLAAGAAAAQPLQEGGRGGGENTQETHPEAIPHLHDAPATR